MSRFKDGWITPEEALPAYGTPVLIARIKDPQDQPIVEQAMRTAGGWWKVYGTNVKKIVAWRSMPEPPEVES